MRMTKPSDLPQDAEKVRQREKAVIGFVWSVSFVWLNETNQINQINQINKTNQFEHPAAILSSTPIGEIPTGFLYKPRFPAAC
ncbi:MAG: hypothetical protein AABY48_02415 [Nitrospirota bacterium]